MRSLSMLIPTQGTTSLYSCIAAETFGFILLLIKVKKMIISNTIPNHSGLYDYTISLTKQKSSSLFAGISGRRGYRQVCRNIHSSFLFFSSTSYLKISSMETFNHLYAKRCNLYSPITLSLFPQRTSCTINHCIGQG